VRLLAFSLLLISLACTSQTTKTANMEKALPAPDDRKDAHSYSNPEQIRVTT